MFNSSYGGIESDGTLHNMRAEQFHPQESDEPKAKEVFKTEKKGFFGTSFLKNIQTDDLILLGIALLLLLDGDGENDIFVFVIAALVFLS